MELGTGRLPLRSGQSPLVAVGWHTKRHTSSDITPSCPLPQRYVSDASVSFVRTAARFGCLNDPANWGGFGSLCDAEQLLPLHDGVAPLHQVADRPERQAERWPVAGSGSGSGTDEQPGGPRLRSSSTNAHVVIGCPPGETQPRINDRSGSTLSTVNPSVTPGMAGKMSPSTAC